VAAQAQTEVPKSETEKQNESCTSKTMRIPLDAKPDQIIGIAAGYIRVESTPSRGRQFMLLFENHKSYHIILE